MGWFLPLFCLCIEIFNSWLWKWPRYQDKKSFSSIIKSHLKRYQGRESFYCIFVDFFPRLFDFEWWSNKVSPGIFPQFLVPLFSGKREFMTGWDPKLFAKFRDNQRCKPREKIAASLCTVPKMAAWKLPKKKWAAAAAWRRVLPKIQPVGT